MAKRSRFREVFLSACLSLGVTLATLAVLEVFLRVADLLELRETLTERSLAYAYDAELGWAPVPNSSSLIKTTIRTTHYKHNSLGLRDEEFSLDAKPTMMFLGDSFVWGLDSEADERFTELLKAKIPDYKILAAGVSGYGTDQEYLLLKRLWPKVKPAVVVLIFCAGNDRLDNITNTRDDAYHKPYFATQPDGSLALMGQPVPRSHLLYYKDQWLVRNLWLARLATDAYVRLRYPQVFVPDPTEKLVGKIREFVEGNGAKFLVGIQHHDEALAGYLEASHIPFVKLEGAPFYTQGGWVLTGRPRARSLSPSAFLACCPQTISFTMAPRRKIQNSGWPPIRLLPILIHDRAACLQPGWPQARPYALIGPLRRLGGSRDRCASRVATCKSQDRGAGR